MAAIVAALRGSSERFRPQTRVLTRGTRGAAGAASAAGGRVGSWAVHAERAPVRVSTGGRGGGALLERVRVGVPAQAGISRDQCSVRRGGLLLLQKDSRQD